MTTDPITRLRAADPLHGELPAALAAPPALPERRRSWSVLVVANVLLLVTVMLHGLDHTLQDRGLGAVSFEVMLGGFAITASAVISLRSALRRERRASLVSLIAGPWIAFAVVVGHFIPAWGEFSDNYADAGLGFISYAAAGSVVAAGLAVGLAGLRARSI